MCSANEKGSQSRSNFGWIINARPLLLASIGLIWVLVTLAAGIAFFKYEAVPGDSGTTLNEWPAGSHLSLRNDQATLVMIVHPHCPCSNASVYELTEILSKFHNEMSATVLFVKPVGFPDEWARTGLWNSVVQIPGATAQIDTEGAEASRFGVDTSGDVRLYNNFGKLLFAGGITQMRGHIGDNPGATGLMDALSSNGTVTVKAPVFGCPLKAEKN